MNLRRATGPAMVLTMLVIGLGSIGRSVAVASPAHPRAARPARGLPIERCAAGRGTIIAVDFATWGGPIVRGCALHPSTGYALLHAAGFLTAGDGHDGPSFICRLADARFHHGSPYPTPSQQPCTDTPSASAYWSVWLAPAGSTRWRYSQLGAMSDHPAAGEVELWTYGATDLGGTHGSGVPAFSPAQLQAGDRAVRVARAAGRPIRLVDAVPTAADTASGSPAGLIVGIVLALALCVSAGVTAARRRDR